MYIGFLWATIKNNHVVSKLYDAMRVKLVN